MKLENNLGSDPIKKLVLRLAIPSMLAQFVSVFYSIVDRMYIGNIPGDGALALAGVGICGPIVTMVSAFSYWAGVGGAPLMSIRLGEKNEEEARKILANSFMLLTVIGLTVMAAAFLLKDHLLWWFGATEANFPYAREYMTVYLAGTMFAIYTTGLNNFITCQGYAKIAMISVILGAAANIVLDPIFIFALDMGVAGGALATVLSQLASCLFTMCFLFGKKVPVKITFRGYSLRICRRILSVGTTPFLIVLFDNVLIIALNMVLQRFGGVQSDALLTCNAILQSLMLVITMPLGGITTGTQTILGYNYGANRPDRVLEGEKQIVKVCLLFTAVMFILAQTCSRYFVQIFTQDPVYVEMTVGFIRIFTLGVIPLGIQYPLVDGFTGMGIVKIAISLSFFRKFVYLLLVVLIPMLAGAANVFYAEAISDIIAPAVTAAVYLLSIRKILERRNQEARQEVELALKRQS